MAAIGETCLSAKTPHQIKRPHWALLGHLSLSLKHLSVLVHRMTGSRTDRTLIAGPKHEQTD